MKKLFSSTTLRLASTYLLIIMLMSIGFSVVFYRTTSQQLGRQIPPSPNGNNVAIGQNPATDPNHQGRSDLNTPAVRQFLQSRIDEGRTVLQWRLLFLNIGALSLGCVVSYLLARRTLQPIEDAMDAQAQFISDASHELRTPLTAMQTSNEVTLRRPNLTLADARELIAHNNHDIERLKRLSDSLLSLARHTATDVTNTAVKLQDITSEAMTQVVPQASAKNITVEDQVANLTVIGNEAALTQVLVILLDNAVKYSTKDSTVHIKTRQKGKLILLDVRDQGIGIRASDVPHLFRRFYRADYSRTAGERSGYGLGLSIAERIMQSHDSKILVRSKLGEGSTFTLQLRLSDS
jgi:two-component system sensor histidine kinase CiaH